MKRLNNKQKNTIIIVGLLIVGFVCGIATGLSRKNREDIIKDQNIIYKSTISPNEDFVENEKDKVYYTIEITQSGNNIKVVASSNSSFSKDISYEIESNNKITEKDVNVEWQTMIGDTNFTKENQITTAVISISSNGEIISKRKINFISKAIDVLVDTINKD